MLEGDRRNHCTVAGNGTAGYLGDNGPWRLPLELDFPGRVVADAAGDVRFIADNNNNVVREFTPAGDHWTINRAKLRSPAPH